MPNRNEDHGKKTRCILTEEICSCGKLFKQSNVSVSWVYFAFESDLAVVVRLNSTERACNTSLNLLKSLQTQLKILDRLLCRGKQNKNWKKGSAQNTINSQRSKNEEN